MEIDKIIGVLYGKIKRCGTVLKKLFSPAARPEASHACGELPISFVVKMDLLYKRDKNEFINIAKGMSEDVRKNLAEQYYNFSNAYMRKETDPQGATSDLEKAYLLNPTDYKISYELAAMYAKLKQYREARDLFLQLYRRNNKDIKVICNLAEAHFAMEDYNNGAKYLKIARSLALSEEIKKNIDDWMYYYMKEKEYVEGLKNRIQGSEDDVSAHVSLAEIYYEKGKYHEGRALLEKIISKSYSPKAYYLLGAIYYEMGLYGRSAEMLNEALALNKPFPQISNVYLYLGLIYEKDKNYDLAIEMYLKGLEMDKSNRMLYFRLGNCYAQKNMYDEAMKYYERGKMLNV
jgi:tetratricopeptide (TPR) repeat protein